MGIAKSILTNQTANVTSAAVIYDGHKEGATLSCSGTFGGASVQYQHNIANDQEQPMLDWTNIGTAITSNDTQRASISHRAMIRAVVTGASVTTNISCILHYQ